MERLSSSAALSYFAILLLIPSGVAYAEQASALVLEKSGTSNPEVQPYTEVSVGTTVTLSRHAKLVFLHYHTCRTVTVVGGAIKFAAETYTMSDTNKKQETRSSCPRKVTLQASGQVGGVLMRGMGSGATGDTLKLSLRPTFVLVGSRANDFVYIRIRQGNTQILERALDGRFFQWPSDETPLAADTEYELALVPTTIGGTPVTKKFRVTKRARESKGLLLLRVQ